jgi:hypothetical protein
MVKLVAIGDSLTQGFQSAAIYRTDWSFPAIIARSMGLTIPNDFPIPRFPGSGLPLNIEQFLRWSRNRLDSEIDLAEWIFQFPFLLDRFMDDVEDLYEGRTDYRPAVYGGFYYNLAVWGFRVLDSLKIDAEYCQKMIDREEGWLEDDFLGLPAAPMYRTALRVLNPKLREDRNKLTQIGNLKEIIASEQTIESLVIWLGANDCLGTVLDLKLEDMKTDNVSDDPQERRKFNLTHPDVFKKDFERLVTEIKSIIPSDTKVFVGTIPHITIPPVTQGILPFDGKYFAYYGRFFTNANNFSPFLQKHLTGAEATTIDLRIDDFNKSIGSTVKKQGKNWHLVDIGRVLDSLAIKRNELTNSPDRALRDYYASKGISDHPLLRLSPIPNILRLELRNGQRLSGGLFSLDCVHPSTIGYGIVAEAFLESMQKAGVRDADPKRLNWQEIIAQDSLLQAPPQLWENVLKTAEQNATLWDVIFRVLSIG